LRQVTITTLVIWEKYFAMLLSTDADMKLQLRQIFFSVNLKVQISPAYILYIVWN
jgi:hypothetical protein